MRERDRDIGVPFLLNKMYYTPRELAFELEMDDWSVWNNLTAYGINKDQTTKNGKIRVHRRQVLKLLKAIDLKKASGLHRNIIAKLSFREINEILNRIKDGNIKN